MTNYKSCVTRIGSVPDLVVTLQTSPTKMIDHFGGYKPKGFSHVNFCIILVGDHFGGYKVFGAEVYHFGGFNFFQES